MSEGSSETGQMSLEELEVGPVTPRAAAKPISGQRRTIQQTQADLKALNDVLLSCISNSERTISAARAGSTSANRAPATLGLQGGDELTSTPKQRPKTGGAQPSYQGGYIRATGSQDRPHSAGPTGRMTSRVLVRADSRPFGASNGPSNDSSLGLGSVDTPLIHPSTTPYYSDGRGTPLRQSRSAPPEDRDSLSDLPGFMVDSSLDNGPSTGVRSSQHLTRPGTSTRRRPFSFEQGPSQYVSDLDNMPSFGGTVLRERSIAFDVLERDNNALRVELNIKNREMSAARERIAELTDALREQEYRAETAQHKLDNVKQNAEKYIIARDEEITRLNGELQQMESHFLDKLAIAEERIANYDVQAEEIRSLRSRLDFMQGENASSNDSWSSILRTKESQIETMRKDAERKHELEVRVTKNQAEIALLQQEALSLKRQLADAQRACAEQAESYQVEKAALEAKAKKLSADLAASQKLVLELEGRISTYIPEIERLTMIVDGVRSESVQERDKLLHNVQITRTWIRKMETTLSLPSLRGAPIEEELKALETAINGLSQGSGFAISRKQPSGTGTEDEALKDKIQALSSLIGSLNGATGEIKPGDTDAALVYIETMAKRMSEKAAQVTQVTQANTESMRELELQRQRNAVLTEQLQKLREQRQTPLPRAEGTEEVQQLQNDLKQVKDALAAAMVKHLQETTALEAEIARLKADPTLSSGANATDTQLSHKAYAALCTDNDELHAQVDTLSSLLKEKERELALITEELHTHSQSTQRVDELTKANETMEGELERLRVEHEAGLREVLSTRSELSFRGEQIRDLQEQLSVMTQQRNALEERLMDTYNSVAAHDQDKADKERLLQEELSASRIQLQQAVEESHAMQQTKDMIIQRISEELVETRSTVEMMDSRLTEKLKTTEERAATLQERVTELESLLRDEHDRSNKLAHDLAISRETNEALTNKMIKDTMRIEKEKDELEARLTMDRDRLQAQYEETIRLANEQIALLEKQVDELRGARSDPRDGLVDALSSDLDTLKEKHAHTVAELTDKLNELQATLLSEKDASVATITRLTAAHNATQQELESTQKCLEAATGQYDADLRRIRAEARASEEDLRQQLDEANSEIAALGLRLQEHASQKGSEVSALSEALQEAQNAITERDTIVEGTKRVIRDLTTELETLRAAAKTAEMRSNDELREISELVRSFRYDVVTTQADKDSRIEALERRIRDLDAEKNTVTERKDEIIERLSSDLIRLQKQMEDVRTNSSAKIDQLRQDLLASEVSGSTTASRLQAQLEAAHLESSEAERRYTRERSELETQIEKLTYELEKERRESSERLRQTTANSMEQLEILQRELHAAQARVTEDQSDRVTLLSTELIAKNKTIEQLQLQLRDAEERLRRTDRESGQVIKHLQDSIEVLNEQFEEMRTMKDGVIDRLSRQVRSSSSRLPSRPSSASSSRPLQSEESEAAQIARLKRELKETRALLDRTIRAQEQDLHSLTEKVDEQMRELNARDLRIEELQDSLELTTSKLYERESKGM
ncbi:Coiled-coil protein [Giardia muris]|uniref:Coiled-coil protein n=1 Tax=Giardia muris TaxID=5742 RepID=A0A4Z1T529_GIAMU|nr:Coiled-coil protein [Giardia muris]|eukprot:TNJ29113.1 Coiled-coil protein [Giardia muris]